MWVFRTSAFLILLHSPSSLAAAQFDVLGGDSSWAQLAALAQSSATFSGGGGSGGGDQGFSSSSQRFSQGGGLPDMGQALRAKSNPGVGAPNLDPYARAGITSQSSGPAVAGSQSFPDGFSAESMRGMGGGMGGMGAGMGGGMGGLGVGMGGLGGGGALGAAGGLGGPAPGGQEDGLWVTMNGKVQFMTNSEYAARKSKAAAPTQGFGADMNQFGGAAGGMGVSSGLPNFGGAQNIHQLAAQNERKAAQDMLARLQQQAGAGTGGNIGGQFGGDGFGGSSGQFGGAGGQFGGAGVRFGASGGGQYGGQFGGGGGQFGGAGGQFGGTAGQFGGSGGQFGGSGGQLESAAGGQFGGAGKQFGGGGGQGGQFGGGQASQFGGSQFGGGQGGQFAGLGANGRIRASQVAGANGEVNDNELMQAMQRSEQFQEIKRQAEIQQQAVLRAQQEAHMKTQRLLAGAKQEGSAMEQMRRRAAQMFKQQGGGDLASAIAALSPADRAKFGKDFASASGGRSPFGGSDAGQGSAFSRDPRARQPNNRQNMNAINAFQQTHFGQQGGSPFGQQQSGNAFGQQGGSQFGQQGGSQFGQFGQRGQQSQFGQASQLGQSGGGLSGAFQSQLSQLGGGGQGGAVNKDRLASIIANLLASDQKGTLSKSIITSLLASQAQAGTAGRGPQDGQWFTEAGKGPFFVSDAQRVDTNAILGSQLSSLPGQLAQLPIAGAGGGDGKRPGFWVREGDMMAFYEIESFAKNAMSAKQQAPIRGTPTAPPTDVRTFVDPLAYSPAERAALGMGDYFSPESQARLADISNNPAASVAQLALSGISPPSLPPFQGGGETAYIPVKWLTAGGLDVMKDSGNWYWASGDGKRGKGRWVREGGMVRWITEEGEAPVIEAHLLSGSDPTISASPVTAGSWRITRGQGPNGEQNLWMTDGDRKIWLTKGGSGMQIFYWSR